MTLHEFTNLGILDLCVQTAVVMFDFHSFKITFAIHVSEGNNVNVWTLFFFSV